MGGYYAQRYATFGFVGLKEKTDIPSTKDDLSPAALFHTISPGIPAATESFCFWLHRAVLFVPLPLDGE